jgi:hypothetical protein
MTYTGGQSAHSFYLQRSGEPEVRNAPKIIFYNLKHTGLVDGSNQESSAVFNLTTACYMPSRQDASCFRYEEAMRVQTLSEEGFRSAPVTSGMFSVLHMYKTFEVRVEPGAKVFGCIGMTDICKVSTKTS